MAFSEDQLMIARMMIETLPYGLMLLDCQGRVMAINRNCSFLLNITAPEPCGRLYGELLEEHIKKIVDKVVSDTETSGYMLERNFKLSLSGGVQVLVAVSSSIMRDKEGGNYGLTLVFKEMTATQELERMRELDELKSYFISTVSHDLKAPLTSICGYADVLMQFSGDKFDKEETEYLQIIKEEGLRLTNMINNMLNVAAIEAGGLRLTSELCFLRDILHQVIKLAVLKRDKHSFSVDLDQDLPQLWLDRAQMVRVFLNLINNAIKYSPQGGDIRLRGYSKDDNIHIEVTDPGIGMSEETLAHLFEKFFRAESESMKKIKGTGLGLVITKGIVEAHGGTIAVRSNEGKGSTFSVILPRRLAVRKPEQ